MEWRKDENTTVIVEQVAHYNNLVMPRAKGGIKISEDTSTLLSKGHIEEFVIPSIERILTHFGGGYIHYCGQNEHLFNAIMSINMVFGLNFGNPDMHDMEYVLERCRNTGKIYYGVIPKNGNESLEEYFLRLLSASSDDGSSKLLLQYRCSKEQRDQVLDTWTKVCDRIHE